MRRNTLWALATVAALVLLFSYRTSTMGSAGGGSDPTSVAASRATATGGPFGDDDGAGGGESTPTTGGTTSTSPSPPGNPGSPASGGTFTGSAAQTRWGAVQVKITVASGKITKVEVPVHPNSSHRDEEINSRALPILIKATLAAQSSEVDTVSGATVTSEGYRQSLQSAIDQAHLS
jgi:uncharacterized protein with FMN-binding domain